MITDFSHVTISVSDLDRAVEFYERLGLVVTRRIGELDSDGVARAFALQRGHLSVVHLAPAAVTSAFRIDLVQWLDPQPAGPPYPALNYLGLTRLAFRVDDLDRTVRKLRDRGVDSFLSDTPQPFGQGVRSIALTDPDGTIVQLIQGLDALPEQLPADQH